MYFCFFPPRLVQALGSTSVTGLKWNGRAQNSSQPEDRQEGRLLAFLIFFFIFPTVDASSVGVRFEVGTWTALNRVGRGSHDTSSSLEVGFLELDGVKDCF